MYARTRGDNQLLLDLRLCFFLDWLSTPKKCLSNYLPVSVAEGDGHHEPLQPVQDDVEVFVDGLPDAVGALLRPVERQEPVEPEQREQNHGRVDGFPEMKKKGSKGIETSARLNVSPSINQFYVLFYVAKNYRSVSIWG